MAKKMSGMAMQDPVLEGREGDEPHPHEVDDAVRTLERGQEIQNDPKLMPHVHKKMKKKMHSLRDLMAMAPMKAKEESDEQEKMMK